MGAPVFCTSQASTTRVLLALAPRTTCCSPFPPRSHRISPKEKRMNSCALSTFDDRPKRPVQLFILFSISETRLATIAPSKDMYASFQMLWLLLIYNNYFESKWASIAHRSPYVSYNIVYSPLLSIQHPRYAAIMRNTLQIKVGLRIKDLRAACDVSQERFANKIGMDRTYLASIEVGQRNVTLQNLAKIANGFDMTLSEFFEGIPQIDPNG